MGTMDETRSNFTKKRVYLEELFCRQLRELCQTYFT